MYTPFTLIFNYSKIIRNHDEIIRLGVENLFSIMAVPLSSIFSYQIETCSKQMWICFRVRRKQFVLFRWIKISMSTATTAR